MNSLRFSGSAWPETCSAETVVPRMTKRSTPASTTVLANSWVRCGESDAGDGHAGVADLLEPRGDQLGAGSARRRSPASARVACAALEAGDLRRAAARVVVPGPQALEVEHAEAAELAERDRGRRRHHRVHRRGQQRQLEAVGVDLPGDRDLLGVARAPRAARSRCRRRSRPRRPRLPRPISISVIEALHLRVSAARVVGGLDGHLDVVRVALLERGRGDPDELALLLQLGDGAGADVEHRLVQAADRAGGRRRRAGRGRRPGPRCPRARSCRRWRPRPGSSGPWSRTSCPRLDIAPSEPMPR